MPNQKPWSVHEAVILLDEYLKVSLKQRERKQSIAEVSAKLRQMAKNQGLEIDDVYRNVNGITFQMASMESAYVGRTIMKPASKLFLETVSLYKADREKFERILKEANTMCAAKKSNEERYAAWLSSKVSPDTLSELYYLYNDIDKYMQRNKVISSPLLTITDISIIKNVQRTIEQSKLFRMSRKSKLYMCGLAVRYYLQFLESETDVDIQESGTVTKIADQQEKNPIAEEKTPTLVNQPITSGTENVSTIDNKSSSAEEVLRDALRKECENNTYGTTVAYLQSEVRCVSQAQIKTILKSADWAEFKFGTWRYVAPVSKQGDSKEAASQEQVPLKLTVDFANLPELQFTTPISVSYFGEETSGISSWSQAYLVVVAALYEDYSHILRPGMSFTLNGDGRVDLGTKQMSHTMRNPKRLPLKNVDLYLEANVSANSIVAKIKILLDLCCVDYENVIVDYVTNKNKAKETTSVTSEHIQQGGGISVEKQFHAWLRNVAKMSESTSRGYMWALRAAVHFAEEQGYSNTELFAQDYATAKSVFDCLMAEPAFIKMNREQNYRYSIAMNKLMEFYTSPNGCEKRKALSDYGDVDTSAEKDFVAWLRNVANISDVTCRSYLSALRKAVRFAIENKYPSADLLSSKADVANAVANKLLADSRFAKLNSEQNYRYSIAIHKLMEYHQSRKCVTLADNMSDEEPATPKVLIDTAPYVAVLKEKFARGFRLGSSLDMKKFKRLFETYAEEGLDFEDDEIERIIRSCGIIHDGKVYLPEIMITSETKNKLLDYIEDSFAAGKTTIYFEALFRLFSDDFLGYYIYDADMLKAYLAHINNGQYYILKNCISKDAHSVTDPYNEVRDYMKQCAVPMDSDEICQVLSHIPEAKVKQILGTHGEFVNNGKSTYFHVSILHLYDEDLDHVHNIIDSAIKDNGFISGNELFKAIKALRPHITENNAAISALGMRDSMKYHLGSEFSFNGNIISDKKRRMMMSDVFSEYAKKRTSFSLAELSTLASELETGIYFESVFENALRISHDEFVSKADAKFDIEQTDKILDRFCTGRYMAIGNVTDFGIFPDAGYQWNCYLLEQYAYAFSKRYRLLHVGFNQHSCVGAIVRRSAGIDSFDDFIVEVLADCNVELTKAKALTYLVEQGYIAKRNYSNIEPLLIQANAQRNKKGK